MPETGVVLRPQPGPQEAFLTTPADIAVYGGAAGGGKTWSLLADPLRYVGVAGFGAVVFRRTVPDITNEGGLWDESRSIYGALGARPRENTHDWTFDPHATRIKFSHLQHATDVDRWKGSQVPAILFDQLEEFTARQFWYMNSRNRSLCGVRPYVRATVNPDPDSWVKVLLAPWVDVDHPEYPFEPGVLRYITRAGDDLVWVGPDWRDPDGLPARSITFIPASIYDNPILLERDPGYLAALRTLSYVDRMRLLGDPSDPHIGWRVRQDDGVFDRGWFRVVETAPPLSEFDAIGRSWDEAGTADAGDWTVGALVGLKDGTWYILDIIRAQATAAGVDALMDQAAALDGWEVPILLQQDPGSAGKRAVAYHVGRLPGRQVRSQPPTGDKALRARPLAAAAEAGRVCLVRRWPNPDSPVGGWIEGFINEAASFTGASKNTDDQIDAVSWATLMLSGVMVKGGAHIPADDGAGRHTGMGGRRMSHLHSERRGGRKR